MLLRAAPPPDAMHGAEPKHCPPPTGSHALSAILFMFQQPMCAADVQPAILDSSAPAWPASWRLCDPNCLLHTNQRQGIAQGLKGLPLLDQVKEGQVGVHVLLPGNGSAPVIQVLSACRIESLRAWPCVQPHMASWYCQK